MTVKEKVKSHPNVVVYLKELPFYNKHIEKPKFKRLKNIDSLSELPFYRELNVIKTDHAFRGYAMRYKSEIIEKKDPINQLEASKTSIKDLFKELLVGTKGFTYQITLKVTLKIYKPEGEIEFSPVHFNSATKIVINHKFGLDKSFQEILYRIDNWINEGSGWIVELIESQYINISTYRALSGISYVKLPVELRNPKKGLINIKNNDQKCFLWCHVRHINSVKIHSERITREDKRLVNSLNYDGIEFSVREKGFSKIEKRTTFALTCFVMKTNWLFQFTFQIKVKLRVYQIF